LVDPAVTASIGGNHAFRHDLWDEIPDVTKDVLLRVAVNVGFHGILVSEVNRDLVSVGWDDEFGVTVVVLFYPVGVDCKEMVNADLVAGWHHGVSGFSIENLQCDGFCFLGMQSARQYQKPHEQQRANRPSSHFPSRNYQVE